MRQNTAINCPSCSWYIRENLFGLHSSWSCECVRLKIQCMTWRDNEIKLESAEECKHRTWMRAYPHYVDRDSIYTYKKSLKPLNWMSLVVCMVWYPGLHNCPNHRTAPANEADIIRNKTADTNQIHKQKHNFCSNTGWDDDWYAMGDIILILRD